MLQADKGQVDVGDAGPDGVLYSNDGGDEVCRDLPRRVRPVPGHGKPRVLLGGRDGRLHNHFGGAVFRQHENVLPLL